MIFLLILLIPTQFRYHFWPAYSYIQGIKVDYLSIHISLFDLVWALVLFLFLLRVLKRGPLALTRRPLMKGSAFLFVVIVLNLLFSRLPWNSLYKYFQLFQAISLYWILINLPNQKNVLMVVKKALTVGLGLASLLAIWQFMLNRSVGGPWYLWGERAFLVTTPGISTFMLWGKEYIRPYSFFSHPNSLAGYLGASLLVVPMPAILKSVVLLVLLLTNSWNAIIALFVVFILKRGSPHWGRPLKKSLVFVFLLFNFSFYLLSWFFTPDVLVSAQRGIVGRMFLTKEVLLQAGSFLPFGLGAGNEVLATVQSNFFWTPQPVHNLLLILFVSFGLLIFPICYLACRQASLLIRKKKGLDLVTFLLITSTLDHYWWTLPQNLLLLPVLFYMITSNARQKNN